MFIENKYYRWYCTLIERSKSRAAPPIVEKHHIIPKSFGGSNEKANLAVLTPREHLIAHQLLLRCTAGDQKMKMSYALWLMCNYNRSSAKVTSRIYENARKTFCAAQSKAFKGRKTPWSANNFKNLEHNGNAKVWDVTLVDGSVTRMVGAEFAKFCKDNNISQGNITTYGKSKGVSAVCLGRYYDLIKTHQYQLLGSCNGS